MKASRLVYSATAIAALALCWLEPARAASQYKVTFYGSPDNDPPCSADIAHPVIHEKAGGTGTFEDPITVATHEGSFAPGTRMYVPSLEKYLIVEDTCASCGADHIDIWMESDCQSDAVLACEDAWTPDEPVDVEINPPAGRSVSTTPFFDKSSGQCNR
jgi:3D (Asp-Asp-Asp) domain-containing protein